MMGVPSLYPKNLRTRKLEDAEVSVPAAVIHRWVAMESIPGAEVRVTVRSGEAVRLEVIRKPDEDQQKRGISSPWYRDATTIGADVWLWEAVKSSDLSEVPDGEWAGQAIGENINKNSMDIDGHLVVFSSLFPWRDLLEGVEIPPELGRTPVGFEDLHFWLATTASSYKGSNRSGIPIDGVVWWDGSSPIAQVKAKEFPKIVRPPNPDAELPEVFEEPPFVYEVDE